MQDRINNDARNVITAHGMLDQLCVVAWMEGATLQVLAHKGQDKAIAMMLYAAADVFADRAAVNAAGGKVR